MYIQLTQIYKGPWVYKLNELKTTRCKVNFYWNFFCGVV